MPATVVTLTKTLQEKRQFKDQITLVIEGTLVTTGDTGVVDTTVLTAEQLLGWELMYGVFMGTVTGTGAADAYARDIIWSHSLVTGDRVLLMDGIATSTANDDAYMPIPNVFDTGLAYNQALTVVPNATKVGIDQRIGLGLVGSIAQGTKLEFRITKTDNDFTVTDTFHMMLRFRDIGV